MDIILKLVLEIIGRSVVADWNRREPAYAIKPGDKLVRQLKGSSFSVEVLLFKRLSAMCFYADSLCAQLYYWSKK